MKLMTDEEVKQYNEGLKKIRGRWIKACMKWKQGTISMAKYGKIKQEVVADEIEYKKKSGVIQYYGKLFKADS